MWMLKWMYSVTRTNIIRIERIRENLGAPNVTGKMRENGLKRFGRVMKRNNEDLVKKIGEIIIKRNQEKNRPKNK